MADLKPLTLRKTMPWSAFYRECRREMEFRYGVKRVPKDYYKEQFPDDAQPVDVAVAARAIYRRLQAEGR